MPAWQEEHPCSSTGAPSPGSGVGLPRTTATIAVSCVTASETSPACMTLLGNGVQTTRQGKAVVVQEEETRVRVGDFPEEERRKGEELMRDATKTTRTSSRNSPAVVLVGRFLKGPWRWSYVMSWTVSLPMRCVQTSFPNEGILPQAAWKVWARACVRPRASWRRRIQTGCPRDACSWLLPMPRLSGAGESPKGATHNCIPASLCAACWYRRGDCTKPASDQDATESLSRGAEDPCASCADCGGDHCAPYRRASSCTGGSVATSTSATE